MWKYLTLALGVLICQLVHATGPLVVSYATTQLNQTPNTVMGILVTPSGQVLQTDPMGPYTHSNIIVATPEVGAYQAYFEVVNVGRVPLCPFAGGIVATIYTGAMTPIAFSPVESRIQSFPFGKQIQVGDTSQPVCSFQITTQDLQ